MKFNKFKDIESSTDDDRQALECTTPPAHHKDEKPFTEIDKNLILSMLKFYENLIKKLNLNKQTNKHIFLVILLLLLFLIFNLEYLDINQVCPYDNDFDCYFRYFYCEDDCNLSKPLIQQGFDFFVEERRNESYLLTRLAFMIYKLIILSAFFAGLLALSVFKRQARILIPIVFINLAVLRFYRDGLSHGDYTTTIGNWLLILVSTFTVLFILSTLLIRFGRKGRKNIYCILAGFLILFASVAIGVYHRYANSCNNWDIGLYGERVDNTVNCKLDTPKVCTYEFYGGTYDWTFWTMSGSCENRKPHWALMDKEFANASKVGFPTVTKLSKEQRQFMNVTKYVTANLGVVDETNEKDYEVVLRRTVDEKTGAFRDPVWIDINVQFNKELVQERSKLVSDSVVNNVMVIYIDTMSRAAAFRSLPETMKAFEKLSTHQFFKYHSITPYTLGNMYPMFYGIGRPDRPTPVKDEEAKSFIHQYKDKGFITGRALSHCAISAINTDYDAEFFRYIDEEPFDHEGIGWACDPNARAKVVPDLTTGPMSMVRKCLYGKDQSEYVLDYGKKFWNTYKDQKKFLWMDFLDFHDVTFSQGQYLDGHLSKFFNEMDLSDTLLLMISDHGLHIFNDHSLYSRESPTLERATPALMAKLPKNLESVYGENLNKNKNQMIQAFDINKLFMALPNPEKIQDTMFYPIPEKKVGCDVVWDQDCHCKLE